MGKKKKQDEQTVENFKKYDSAWKDLIEELLEPFLEFFFPVVHADIDFSKEVEFLSQELRKIAPGGTVGQRYADELIKVHLKDGSTKCIRIFIHLEIQGKSEDDFEERVFIYFYRIFDRHREEGTEVVSLVVLTDENKKYLPDEYRISRWGFEVRMKFPLVKLIDYKNKKKMRKKLETSTNPMAMVVKAQLKSYELKKADDKKKSTVKWELIRQCYEKGYGKIEIDALFKFIDWLIRLPDELTNQLEKRVLKLEEEYKMPYVTSFERLAEKRGKKRGEEIGEKRGEKRGMEKAKLETARELVKNGVDIDIIAKATGLSREKIEELAESVHLKIANCKIQATNMETDKKNRMFLNLKIKKVDNLE
jgi:predicted transposase/invertase (TIGR01784 family)